MIGKTELMHYRLQAWLREYSCKDIEYLGMKDYQGKDQHYYRIGTNEVPVCCIEDLDLVEDY